MSNIDFREDYNRVPYPAFSYAQTHPDHLATLAHLLGHPGAAPGACRYLDVGCAVGGNILPLAEALPGSQFVGIDRAEGQIATGRDMLAQLGLTNVRLETMDILEPAADLGAFDYIVAHGIYSWVPANVRDGLLALIQRHLAPNGVAYVSYNVYPGWHMMRIVREMMQFRIRHLTEPTERAQKAQEFVRFVVESNKNTNSSYIAFLNQYLEGLSDKYDQGDERGHSLMLHDELADVNQPVHFMEFAEHAARHGLQFMVEAELAKSMPARYPREVKVELVDMAQDPLEIEQYLDYLQNRYFRQSLLVHQEATFTKRLRPEAVYQLCFTSKAQPADERVDLAPGAVATFRGSDGSTFASDHPLSKAAFVTLGQAAPQSLTYDQLAAGAAATLREPEVAADPGQRYTLAANLLQAYTYSKTLVDFHFQPPPFVTRVSDRPLASAIARQMALTESRVTNRRQERVILEPIHRVLLAQLDGSRDLATLLAFLQDAYQRGDLVLKEPAADGELVDPTPQLETILDESLRFFARAALLIG